MNVYGVEADAVLFDCDGVLVDSEPLSFRAWAAALAGHGLHLTRDDFTHAVGRTDRQVAEQYARRLAVPPEALEAAAQRAFEEIVPSVERFADAGLLLDRAERDQVPVAVASNCRRWRLDALLGAVGLERLIELSFASDEVASPKPAPDLYVAAARATGVAPERCVAIEDSPTGVASAQAAGCRVVAVDRGEFPPGALADADLVLTDLG